MIEQVNINEVTINPNNPRLIKDDKFEKLVKSIQEFPEMLKLRPIVVDDNMVVLGGNMRLQACKKAKLKKVWIIKASELTEEQKKEFIIKDNVGFGEWDWEMLANEWESEKLIEWGLEIPGFDVNAEELGTEFSLPDGDKAPFQQMTFTLADEKVSLQERKSQAQEVLPVAHLNTIQEEGFDSTSALNS